MGIAPLAKRISPLTTPKSHTLPVLTLQWLKKAIRERRWKEHLPSERQLSSDLQVSREVLRHALKKLQKEGWILKTSRTKTKILHKSRKQSPSGARKLVVLSARPLSSHPTALTLNIYRKIFAHALDQGFRVIEIHDPRLADHAPARALESYLAENPGSVWLLAGVCSEVQKYYEQTGISAIILGHRYPGIHLCAVDMDTQTACWHATVRLLRKKCRSLSLLFFYQYRAGDIAAKEGFEQAIKPYHERSDMKFSVKTIKSHQPIDALIAAALAEEFQPVGFIVMNPHFVVALASRCLACGLHIGRDVHIISIFDDPVLDMLPGKIPRYSRTGLYEKAAELVLKALHGLPLQNKQYLFLPEFLG